MAHSHKANGHVVRDVFCSTTKHANGGVSNRNEPPQPHEPSCTRRHFQHTVTSTSVQRALDVAHVVELFRVHKIIRKKYLQPINVHDHGRSWRRL
jgi:hypothetical protein